MGRLAPGGQAKPLGWLQYIKSASQNLGGGAGSSVAVVFDVDAGSEANGYFDKPSTSQFRALQPCLVRISYGLSTDSTANDDGWEAVVRNNGVSIGALSNISGRSYTNITEPGFSYKSFLYQMAANDVLDVLFTKLEATTTQTVTTRSSYFTVEILRFN